MRREGGMESSEWERVGRTRRADEGENGGENKARRRERVENKKMKLRGQRGEERRVRAERTRRKECGAIMGAQHIERSGEMTERGANGEDMWTRSEQGEVSRRSDRAEERARRTERGDHRAKRMREGDRYQNKWDGWERTGRREQAENGAENGARRR
jgi:hypothetical protein